MGQRGTKPQCSVSTKWTPELAYAVGLLVTDGCLSKDGRHIDFTSKDKKLVLTFCRCLKLKNSIGRKTSGYTGRKDHFRVQFGDVSFYDWLVAIGLSPHKSRSLKGIEIPDSLFFDFIHGCFDGDGTIYSFWDRRWTDSFMFYIAFASGSNEFLLWMRGKLKNLLEIKGHISSGTRNTFQLKYAKRESILLFRRMFYAKEIPHLARKRLKAQNIFNIHARVVDRNKLARVL